MNRVVVASLTLLLGLSCATTPAPAPSPQLDPPPAASTPPPAPAPAPKKFDFAAMMAREVSELPMQKVVLREKTFEVESKGTPAVEPGEGEIQISIPIGTQQPILCHLRNEGFDTGTLITNVLAPVKQSFELQGVAPVGVELAGQSPLVFLNAVYLAPTASGKSVGLLKLMVLSSNQFPLYCFHDEPGYNKSFARIVTGLATALEKSAPVHPSQRYAEVSKVSIGPIPVGFQKQVIAEGEGGKFVLTSEMTMLLPRTASELLTTDEASTEVVDAKGRTISEREVNAKSGEVDLDITLTRGKGNLYSFEGTTAGKKVKGSFRSKDKAGLPSILVQARALVKAKGKVQTFEVYSASTDHTKALTETITPDPAEPSSVVVQLGTLELKGKIDAQGMMESGSMPIPGGATMEFSRMFAEGKLP
jgi:hypothetical protein